MTDLFNCLPLASVLSRNACGARWERKIGATCANCAVGRQHARGALPDTWPDGSVLTTAAVTIATMASLKVHLAIIASYSPPPLRGVRLLGATIREHAERAGLHPQVIRQRLLRGRPPENAVEPGLRERAKVVTVRGEALSLRALARKAGVHHRNVQRWIVAGMTPEQILRRTG